MAWLGVIKSVLGMGGSLLSGWAERKKIKAQAAVEIEKAKAQSQINRAANAQQAEIDWDTQNTKNAQTSWKDEFWTIVLAIPLVMCFIPGLSFYVQEGFASIKDTPEWYQVALGLAIAASFGYRKFVDWQMKKGNI